MQVLTGLFRRLNYQKRKKEGKKERKSQQLRKRKAEAKLFVQGSLVSQAVINMEVGYILTAWPGGLEKTPRETLILSKTTN